MSPAPVRLAFLGVCLLLSLSVAAASGSPVWERAPSPELLARLRSEWFIPPLPTESEGQVREGQIEECGTKVVWKESGRQSRVGQILGNLVSKKAIARYDPLRILGQGTQGVVILAKDLLNDQLVAIKEERPKALAREIRLLQAVQSSDDIMKLEDVLMPKHIDKMSSAFAVYERLVLPINRMHRMWGGAVHSAVPSKAMKRILFNIVRGVHFLHTNNIVHLDLKPDNVMLDENCAPKVVDLGISKLLYDEDGRELMTSGYSLKHGSRAPEYSGRSGGALQKMKLGPDMAKAADLWSLGVVLLSALHGGDGLLYYHKVSGVKREWYLEMLVSMLGRPSERALKKYYAKGLYDRLMSFSKTPSLSMQKAFPHVNRAALAMIQRLMKMDPSSRASTRDILLDPYFAGVRNAASHNAALAEDLVPDPRIPALIHSKKYPKKTITSASATVIYELALAYSPAAAAGAQDLRNGTHLAAQGDL